MSILDDLLGPPGDNPTIGAATMARSGLPGRIADNTINDSDKTMTVSTTEKGFEVHSIWCKLVSGVTVGNRHMCVTVSDQAGNITCYVEQPHDQAALATHYYLWANGIANNSDVATYEWIAFPKLVVPDGYTIRVFDASAIDATGDDMEVEIMGVHL